ncbi:MAG: flagellar assembly protein A [Pseudomonadota bacterium]
MSDQANTPPNGVPPSDQAKSLVWLTISPDGLTAALSGRAEAGVDRRQVQVHITNLLRERGVKFGLSYEHMREAMHLLLEGQEIKDLVIAQGQPCEPPQDARIEVLVALPDKRAWRQDDQGNIDFRDRGAWPTVEAGTPLAALHPPAPGKPGRNVLGQDIKPSAPRVLRLKKGRGVELQQDGRVAVATARGIINRPEEEKFEILETLEIKGDVDFNVGHVDFPGLVRVHGAVLSDFRVRAHTLECETLENRSRVEVVADLKVNGGIMGAMVIAGGKVTARYVRQSRINCASDCVISNEIVSSQVICNGRVVVSANDGRIVNTQVSAIRGVTTTDLVSSAKNNTQVSLGVRPEFEQKLTAVKRQLTALTREGAQLEEVLIGQEGELSATEEELRGILAALADPEQQAQRENLLTQVHMIKPLRDTLKEGVIQGRQRLEDIAYESQRLGEKLAEMEALLPPGTAWLDVRGKAESGIEIRTPRASLILERNQASFSARERELKDKATGTSSFVVHLGNLRSGA